jgi:hypothetical protein
VRRSPATSSSRSDGIHEPPERDCAGKDQRQADAPLQLGKARVSAQAVQPRTAYDDYKINELLWYVYLQQGKTKEAITQWHASLKEWQASPKSEVDAVQIAEINKKLESARVRLARETGAK